MHEPSAAPVVGGAVAAMLRSRKTFFVFFFFFLAIILILILVLPGLKDLLIFLLTQIVLMFMIRGVTEEAVTLASSSIASCSLILENN